MGHRLESSFSSALPTVQGSSACESGTSNSLNGSKKSTCALRCPKEHHVVCSGPEKGSAWYLDQMIMLCLSGLCLHDRLFAQPNSDPDRYTDVIFILLAFLCRVVSDDCYPYMSGEMKKTGLCMVPRHRMLTNKVKCPSSKRESSLIYQASPPYRIAPSVRIFFVSNRFIV